MADGRLVLRGFFSTSQFYPQSLPKSASDADTLKVALATAHFVRPDGTATDIWKELSNAYYEDKEDPANPKKERVLNWGAVKARLQGVDAPELHYPVKMVEYRQMRGAYVARRLNEALRIYGEELQPCELVTRVDKPADAFDVYGRLICNVLIGPERRDLNLFLLREGLVLPTIYNSMTKDEIEAVLSATKRGREANDSIWKQYSTKVAFDSSVVFNKPYQVVDVETSDRGPFILPKLFRRVATHTLEGKPMDTFKQELAAGGERVMLTSDALQGTVGANLALFADQLVEERNADGTFVSVSLNRQPEELVFLETDSKLWIKEGSNYTEWT
jgi:endonuclease YncB( thermonuclease family)